SAPWRAQRGTAAMEASGTGDDRSAEAGSTDDKMIRPRRPCQSPPYHTVTVAVAVAVADAVCYPDTMNRFAARFLFTVGRPLSYALPFVDPDLGLLSFIGVAPALIFF